MSTTAELVLIGTLLGVIYVMFSDGFGSIYPFIAGAGSGLVIGLLFSFLELVTFTGEFRKLKFGTILATRTLTYLVVVILVILIITSASRSLPLGTTLWEVLGSPDYRHYITQGDFPIAISYAALLILLINLFLLVNRKMGQGVLLNYVAGTYYYPRKSEKIFMFLNLENSKELADKNEGLALLSFLNEFYYDITEPLLVHHGNIYQYVDDQAVITWSMKKGTNQANCLRAAFGCKERIKHLHEKYLNKYGIAPKLSVGLHCGWVIRGEVGEVKTDIAYHGDTMNTAARIAYTASQMGEGVVISAHLYYRLQVPSIYKAEPFAKVKLKGKKQEMELMRISETGLQNLFHG